MRMYWINDVIICHGSNYRHVNLVRWIVRTEDERGGTTHENQASNDIQPKGRQK